MKLVIKLFGVLIILLGISLLIDPELLFGWLEASIGNSSLYIIAIVFRIVFGISLIMAAKESKYPGVIKFFGYLAIIVAIIFISVGSQNFQDFFSSLIPKIKPHAPVSGLIDIAVGTFLIYAFSGNKGLEPT